MAEARETGDRGAEGAALVALGGLAGAQRPAEALGYFERAQVIARETGNRRAEASCLTALGSLVALQGRIEEARANFEQALEISKAMGDKEGVQNARYALGLLPQERRGWGPFGKRG